jgi:hypothetical protein
MVYAGMLCVRQRMAGSQGLPPPMPGVLEGEEVRMSLMQEPPLQLNFAARSIGA